MLTKLSLEALLDREFAGRHRAERLQITEVPYLLYEIGDREDVRLHQPRYHNASNFGLQGYVDTLSPLVAMHHHDLVCA
mgnify:CR=1 FL=1